MRVIHKYPFHLSDDVAILVPGLVRILHIDKQRTEHEEILTLWALIDLENADYTEIRLRVIGTGHKHPEIDGDLYVATVFDHDFVWHVFHQKEIPDAEAGEHGS